MKIKWIGKYDGNNLPTVDVGTGAKELPEVTSKSAIMLLRRGALFCGFRFEAPGQWGQAGQNAVYVTVPFRGIRVFRRSPANTGKQTQEFAANLCHTSCCERQNHWYFL